MKKFIRQWNEEPDVYAEVQQHLVDQTTPEEGHPNYKQILRMIKMAPKVWGILVEKVSTGEAIKEMTTNGLCTTNMEARQHIKDAEAIYGRMRVPDEDGRRMLLIEITEKMLAKAADKGDYKSASRLIGYLMRLEGLASRSPQMVNVFNQLKLPALQIGSDASQIKMEELHIETD